MHNISDVSQQQRSVRTLPQYRRTQDQPRKKVINKEIELSFVRMKPDFSQIEIVKPDITTKLYLCQNTTTQNGKLYIVRDDKDHHIFPRDENRRKKHPKNDEEMENHNQMLKQRAVTSTIIHEMT